MKSSIRFWVLAFFLAHFVLYIGCAGSSTADNGTDDDTDDTDDTDDDDTDDATTELWSMFQGGAQHTGQSGYAGPTSATVKWSYQYGTSQSALGTPPKNFVVDSQNRVYANTTNTLFSFDENGTILWSVTLTGAGAAALSSDEATVYVAEESILSAYTTTDGTLEWSYDTGSGSPIHGEPVVASDDGTICFGSWDHFVYCLNSDGTLQWKYETDGSIAPLASPTFSADETAIYVGSGDPNEDADGKLYALDRDGVLQWSETVDSMRASGVAAASDGSLYINGGGRSHHFDSDGTSLWESDPDLVSNLLPALASQGIVYSGTAEGLISAIDAETGDLLWSYQTGENPDYDPTNIHDPQYGVVSAPVIDSNGTVYMGAVDGKMVALDTDGTVLWTYETGDGINENGPAIGPNGTLYFSSSDGTIYAIGE